MRRQASPGKAQVLQRFFKTGPGEYGEGDVFLGLTVPELRKLVRKHSELPESTITGFIQSGVHEERLFGLLVLVHQFAHGDERTRKRIYTFYMKNTRHVNNWDLVDLSAHHIVGGFLLDKDRSVLLDLAKSDNLWERRIAILSTFQYIRKGDFADTLAIAELLLQDPHDLIHKAVGWMLREIGKRDLATEERFLKPRYKTMPRTMLRYAIEKFPEVKRRKYLHGQI
jgi:3-methyladenine DNA glycosylase AlkD